MDSQLVMQIVNPKLFFGLLKFFWNMGLQLVMEITVNKNIVFKGIRQDMDAILLGEYPFDSMFKAKNDIDSEQPLIFCPLQIKKLNEYLKNFISGVGLELVFEYSVDNLNRLFCSKMKIGNEIFSTTGGQLIIPATQYREEYNDVTSEILCNSNKLLFSFTLQPQILQKVKTNQENKLSIFLLIVENGELLVFSDNEYQLILTEDFVNLSDKDEYIKIDSRYLRYLTSDEVYQVQVGTKYIHFTAQSDKHEIFIAGTRD
ncbi:MAG: hypothetical protein NT007_01150 [Candidatus Kapabacteria bacterium]|nr:hypothetical protein [Candidatus Kapabacteria bacterium]